MSSTKHEKVLMMNCKTTETYFKMSSIFQIKLKVLDIGVNGFKNNETFYQLEQAAKEIDLIFTKEKFGLLQIFFLKNIKKNYIKKSI